MLIGCTIVTGNAIGVTIDNGSAMTSLGNNLISDNITSGPSLPIIGPQ